MRVDEIIRELGRLSGDGTVPARRLSITSQFLAGKSLLVTGAGGSIGSAFCRIAARLGPSALAAVDRDDSALHALGLSLSELAGTPPLTAYLRDICDREAMQQVMCNVSPDIVIHAAALKHVPLLEEHPQEAFRVNVEGTHSVLSAAATSGADVVVHISTDKASNPISVLGMTKRLGEGMTAHFNQTHSGRYVNVRFGNVIASRGSLLPTFLERIDLGLPLQVTHEKATRFLMTAEKAIELIVGAAECGEGGDTLIADMGEPVRILEIATELLRSRRVSLPVEIIGLRPGEKVHEDYYDDSETLIPETRLPDLYRTWVSPVDHGTLTLRGFLADLERTRAARP